MAMALPLPLLLLLSVLLPVGCSGTGGSGDARKLGFRFHHRFSSPVLKRWVEQSGREIPGGWPEIGSVDYLSALLSHDRGRALAARSEEPTELTFADGNVTVQSSSLGYLHYAMVSIGTPSKVFMVALDTGSNLFWLPCNCGSCAPTSSSLYPIEFYSTLYSPDLSETSRRIGCDSNLCEYRTECSASSGCQYKIVYLSTDTSSLGFLVEDVLYLATEDSHSEIVEAQIVFGCGQVQTGSFLNAAAPNGLMGLGMERISVPSILSSIGLVSGSFSMCFGHDGIGRISFGDQGSTDQEETPLHLNEIHPNYNITVTGMSIGNISRNVEFSTLFDTGTSFTYLTDPAYTYLTDSFHGHVSETRIMPDSRIPFEYCYYISSKDSKIETPPLSFTVEGGGLFSVHDPGEVIQIEPHGYVYCLAVVKSGSLNIIGQNFMAGLRVVFDRQREKLGWKKFNCYDVENSNPLSVNPRNSTHISPCDSNNYSSEAAKTSGNQTHISNSRPVSNSPYTNLPHDIFSTIYLIIILLVSSNFPIFPQ